MMRYADAYRMHKQAVDMDPAERISRWQDHIELKPKPLAKEIDTPSSSIVSPIIRNIQYRLSEPSSKQRMPGMRYADPFVKNDAAGGKWNIPETLMGLANGLPLRRMVQWFKGGTGATKPARTEQALVTLPKAQPHPYATRTNQNNPGFFRRSLDRMRGWLNGLRGKK